MTKYALNAILLCVTFVTLRFGFNTIVISNEFTQTIIAKVCMKFKMLEKMDDCIDIKGCYISFDEYIILIPKISLKFLARFAVCE